MGLQTADLAIIGGTVITPWRRLPDTTVLVAGGKIVGVESNAVVTIPPELPRIDATNQFVVPGFIDIHVNGGGGGDALDATRDALAAMCATHAAGGTTSLVPTTVTAPLEVMCNAVRVIGEVAQDHRRGRAGNGAQVLGAYIEGPFLSPQQKGAHNPDHLRIPAETDSRCLLDLAEHIRMVALAPELPGSPRLIEDFASRGVRTAVAHSQATYEEVMAVIELGTTHVAHLFSTMSSMFRKPGDYRKYAGVTEAALLSDDLSVEVVGDGYHVPEPLLRLALKNKPEGTLCVVTDAMRAAGKGPGHYKLSDMDILVEDGIALLPDRSLFAGSVATMDMCVRTLVTLGGLPIERAVRAATFDPARVVGVQGRKGSIRVGADADIVVLDDTLHVTDTVIGGRRFEDGSL